MKLRKLVAMTFETPHYRRTANGWNRYRIDGADRFTELQRLGGRWMVHEVRDAPYPERVRIVEMLDGLGGTYVEDDGEAFERLLAEVQVGG